MDEHFDLVIVGTSFAASFFLLRYLEHAPPNAKILVLERGNEDTKAWQLANKRHPSIEPEEVFENTTRSRSGTWARGSAGTRNAGWAGPRA